MPFNPITGPVFQIYGGQENDGESGWRQAINASLIKIDAVISLSVINANQQQDPTSPAAGDRYIVAVDASGDQFIGHDKEVAVYTYSPNGTLGWQFYTPINGLKAFSINDSATYIYDSATASWVVLPSTAGSFEIPNVGELSGAYITGATGNFLVDAFDKTLYGACEYTIYVKHESVTPKFQVNKFIVTHNAAYNTYVTDYAKIISNTNLANFSSEIIENNVRLVCSSVTTPLTVRVMKILINI
jgi:hypothetical protein